MARGCADFQAIDREGEGVREQISFDGSGGSAADALDEEGNVQF